MTTSFSTSAHDAGRYPLDSAVADVNGDGNADLVVVNVAGVAVLLGDGKGGFAAPVTYAAGSLPYSVTAADVNGDGNADLIVTGSDGGVSVLLGDGKGGFGAPVTYADNYFPSSVIAGDLNGDGKPDLVVTDGGGQGISIFLNQGSGSFAASTLYPAGVFPQASAVADLNGDGRPDVVVADKGTSSGGGGLSVLLNNGSGGFTAGAFYPLAGFEEAVAAADVNGDGKIDLIALGSDGLTVLLGDGKGGFTAGPALPAVMGLAVSLATADLNDDGNVDIVVASQTGQSTGGVSYLLGDGHGNFSAPSVIPIETTLYSVIAADVNGDGKPDILATGDSGVEVMLNTSNPDPDTLTLRLSEDAWMGDAQFTVSVDGIVAGGVQTVGVGHATGDSEVFQFPGDWGTGTQTVQIGFINDAYGGSITTDRNLLVDSIGYDGVTDSSTTAVLAHDGTSNFTVGGATPLIPAPADTLTLQLSEDAWKGDALFSLTIDGRTIAASQVVTALHNDGAWQDLSFSGNFGTGEHQIGISFLNDAYGGSVTTDRNLYVNGIDMNGQHTSSGVTTLAHTGTVFFNVTTAE